MKAFPGNDKIVAFDRAGHEFLVTPCGRLWIHAKADDVIASCESLMLVFGQFKIDKDAEAAEKKGGCWKFALSSGDDLVLTSCVIAPPCGQYPEGLTTVADFVKFLAKEVGAATPTLECHEIQHQFEKDGAGQAIKHTLTVKVTANCIYVPLKVPKDRKEDYHNLGSRLCVGAAGQSWDWGSGEHSLGRLVLRGVLQYGDAKQYTGIVPGKISIHLKENVKVQARQLRRMA